MRMKKEDAMLLRPSWGIHGKLQASLGYGVRFYCFVLFLRPLLTDLSIPTTTLSMRLHWPWQEYDCLIVVLLKFSPLVLGREPRA